MTKLSLSSDRTRPTIRSLRPFDIGRRDSIKRWIPCPYTGDWRVPAPKGKGCRSNWKSAVYAVGTTSGCALGPSNLMATFAPAPIPAPHDAVTNGCSLSQTHREGTPHWGFRVRPRLRSSLGRKVRVRRRHPLRPVDRSDGHNRRPRSTVSYPR